MSSDPTANPAVADVPLGSEVALLARGPDTRVAPELLAAYAAATAPNSLRAFRSEVLGFAYDTGLCASELVAVAVEDLEVAIDGAARLLRIWRSKGDQQGGRRCLSGQRWGY